MPQVSGVVVFLLDTPDFLQVAVDSFFFKFEGLHDVLDVNSVRINHEKENNYVANQLVFLFRGHDVLHFLCFSAFYSGLCKSILKPLQYYLRSVLLFNFFLVHFPFSFQEVNHVVDIDSCSNSEFHMGSFRVARLLFNKFLQQIFT